MARNALYSEEFKVLGAAIGVIGDTQLREALSAEIWAVLQRLTTGLYDRRNYDREEWDRLCDVRD